MKILIGYDGSECADAAIGDLKRAGLPSVAEARVLSVAEVWLPPPDPDGLKATSAASDLVDSMHDNPLFAKAREAVHSAQNLADKAGSKLSAFFPEWAVTASSSYGSPPWEIIFAADKWQPDLVVVGSQGHSALGRFVLGSVSQVVLTEAKCSVRVARGRGEELDTPIRVLVGIDGSSESEKVVGEIARRSWPDKTQVKLVVVHDPVGIARVIGEDFPPGVDPNMSHAWAEKILVHHAAMLSGSPKIEVTTDLLEGSPKKELLSAAEEWGADVIFVGSSGASNRTSRFVLGSVSAAVSSRAHCSVEVVRKK